MSRELTLRSLSICRVMAFALVAAWLACAADRLLGQDEAASRISPDDPVAETLEPSHDRTAGRFSFAVGAEDGWEGLGAIGKSEEPSAQESMPTRPLLHEVDRPRVLPIPSQTSSKVEQHHTPLIIPSPEPSALALFAFGVVGWWGWVRARRG
jgi:hypothetical protein